MLMKAGNRLSKIIFYLGNFLIRIGGQSINEEYAAPFECHEF